MVTAREIYEHLPAYEEEVVEEVEVKRQKPNPKPNNRFAKLVFSLIIITVLFLCIMLLIRFVSITEARHRVYSLQTELERIENKKEQLKIEVERVSKSKWIEEEAKNRLGMQYPLPEQVLYIHIHPNEVAMISNELQQETEKNLSTSPDTKHGLYTTITKIVGFFKF